MAGASSFFKGRTLPPIGKRRRTRVKDHGIDGDPYIDVDEGIAEEVRIFNDVLGLKTFSSCEGHLVNDTCAALIVSYIDDRGQLEKIKEAMGKGTCSPCRIIKRVLKLSMPACVEEVTSNQRR